MYLILHYETETKMTLLLANYKFTGPVALDEFEYDEENGLYGIFFLKNPEKQAANYGLAYIGNTEDFKEVKEFPKEHKRYQSWIKTATTEDNLYIGLCPTPGLAPMKVELISKHLIYKYNPPGNR